MKWNEKWNKQLSVFVFIKCGKFWSISLGHFIKHKPLISEECQCQISYMTPSWHIYSLFHRHIFVLIWINQKEKTQRSHSVYCLCSFLSKYWKGRIFRKSKRKSSETAEGLRTFLTILILIALNWITNNEHSYSIQFCMEGRTIRVQQPFIRFSTTETGINASSN